MSHENGGWIGVDLDGTLAHYNGWKGVHDIGEPILPMLERVKQWLAEGKKVKIFTARVWKTPDMDMTRIRMANAAREYVEAWCVKHLGRKLEVTNAKDFDMIELWDDRAVQIVFNTGKRADGNP